MRRVLDFKSGAHKKADVPVQWEGRAYFAAANEPLAVTLYAYGERVLSRSGKYHRPRGLFCGRGSCGQCLARVDGVPNERLCQHGAKPETKIESQNVMGSAKRDGLAVIDAMFAEGLDHHHLMTGAPLLNGLAMRMARTLAGVGRLPEAGHVSSPVQIKELEVDAVIVGAGPAGNGVARTLAQREIRPLLLDAHHASTAAPSSIYMQARVVGFYDDSYLLAVANNEQLRIKARAFVLAMGAYELAPACPGNDLPALLSLKAAELLSAWQVLPGYFPVFALHPGLSASHQERAKNLARRLQEHGAEPTIEYANVTQVHGAGRVERVSFDNGNERYCDALIWVAPMQPAYELARQMGVEVAFEVGRGIFIPLCDPEGKSARPGVFIAGELSGVEPDLAGSHGERVGLAVADFCRAGAARD